MSGWFGVSRQSIDAREIPQNSGPTLGISQPGEQRSYLLQMFGNFGGGTSGQGVADEIRLDFDGSQQKGRGELGGQGVGEHASDVLSEGEEVATQSRRKCGESAPGIGGVEMVSGVEIGVSGGHGVGGPVLQGFDDAHHSCGLQSIGWRQGTRGKKGEDGELTAVPPGGSEFGMANIANANLRRNTLDAPLQQQRLVEIKPLGSRTIGLGTGRGLRHPKNRGAVREGLLLGPVEPDQDGQDDDETNDARHGEGRSTGGWYGQG